MCLFFVRVYARVFMYMGVCMFLHMGVCVRACVLASAPLCVYVCLVFFCVHVWASIRTTEIARKRCLYLSIKIHVNKLYDLCDTIFSKRSVSISGTRNKCTQLIKRRRQYAPKLSTTTITDTLLLYRLIDEASLFLKQCY